MLWAFGNAALKEFHCAEAGTGRPNYCLPDLSEELACADDFFSFAQDALDSSQQLTVLVFESRNHTEHETWEAYKQLFL